MAANVRGNQKLHTRQTRHLTIACLMRTAITSAALGCASTSVNWESPQTRSVEVAERRHAVHDASHLDHCSAVPAVADVHATKHVHEFGPAANAELRVNALGECGHGVR